jgi:hypothetical protein
VRDIKYPHTKGPTTKHPTGIFGYKSIINIFNILQFCTHFKLSRIYAGPFEAGLFVPGTIETGPFEAGLFVPEPFKTGPFEAGCFVGIPIEHETRVFI